MAKSLANQLKQSQQNLWNARNLQQSDKGKGKGKLKVANKFQKGKGKGKGKGKTHYKWNSWTKPKPRADGQW